MDEIDELQKRIIKEIDSSNKEYVLDIVSKYENCELKGAALGRIFEMLYVDEHGFSKIVLASELEKIHHSFHTTNGGDWCRSKTSYLGKRYIILREKKGSKIFSIKCDGPEKTNKVVSGIRYDIYSEIKKKRCKILDVSTNIECDHKEGMKDDNRLNDLDDQKISDFQPLCKTANDAKRSHCKKCISEHKRYDAKRLGYSQSFTMGDENSNTCKGCYWYDPYEFNKIISENFKKEK